MVRLIDRDHAEIMKDYSIGSVLSGRGSTPLPQASAEGLGQYG
ncbi:hypothetical protein Patl1_19781 [Pistacia atlantica]|uniref:Uncharacterized protein n=1 Tax=Pistacia atlantica TaxID=434234 RepID=A0ACC1BJ07_9ROSI|nr:hypothetical protein Patl1_19781 [Pistacia atlantica]